MRYREELDVVVQRALSLGRALDDAEYLVSDSVVRSHVVSLVIPGLRCSGRYAVHRNLPQGPEVTALRAAADAADLAIRQSWGRRA